MYTRKVVVTLAIDVENEITATQAAIGCKDMLLKGMRAMGGPDLSGVTTIVNADAHMQPAPNYGEGPTAPKPVATVVSRAGDDLRVGWLRPENCEVGTQLYTAAPAQPSDVPEIGQLQADAIDALSKYLGALERECQGTDEEVEPQFIDSAYILDRIEAESDMISLIAYAVKNELQFSVNLK